MQLLKEWGATAYDYALLYGSHRIEILKLLKSWINYEPSPICTDDE